ncbi:MAG: type I glyceraldehyde-3-phosphate dehydrogenase [Cryomorphaceae bacterium]
MKRIAINGFGRIGRHVMRMLLEDKSVEVVAINDLVEPAMLAHLLEFDTVYGPVRGHEIGAKKDAITIDGREVPVFASKDPTSLPWSRLQVDVVLECSGKFRDAEGASLHIQAGAKKVLISAPAKGEIKNVVFGVNHSDIEATDLIVSAASCTTNCLAPMMHVLHENFTIDKGFIATTHAYTGDQRLLDAPHSDYRRARAAAVNLVPTSTGAAKAIGKVIPALAGKLDGSAIRVPIPSGSLTEATILIEGETTAEAINTLMKQYATDSLRGVLEYSDKPLVSSDILGNRHSCIFDSDLTRVNGNLIRIFGWYDNEVGYSARMIDVLKLV